MIEFNMNYNLSSFIIYNAYIVDGNIVTDLLSIGGKVNAMGPDPSLPAIVDGLNVLIVFLKAMQV